MQYLCYFDFNRDLFYIYTCRIQAKQIFWTPPPISLTEHLHECLSEKVDSFSKFQNTIYQIIFTLPSFIYMYMRRYIFTPNHFSHFCFNFIRLKIKPNSARIRSLSCQMFVLPSTVFELTPLIHCSINHLALCPAP